MCFVVLVYNLFSRELIHYYHGDYNDVVRLVFVFRTNVQYNTMFDTDNKSISVTVSNAKMLSSILRQKFDDGKLIDEITYETRGNDLLINIKTNVVYYPETFNLKERTASSDVFKLVIDVYRQKEPSTLTQAQSYVTFFDIVGFKDRATALRRRINAGAFSNIMPETPTIFNPNTYTTTPTQTVNTNTQSPMPPLPEQRYLASDPMQYIMPDDIHLNEQQRNWVNEAFRVYNMFKNIYRVLDDAETTLRIYEEKRTVNISFINTMSLSYNSLSDANIQINQIRLQFMNLNQRRNFPSNQTIEYTSTMIAHVMRMLDSIQGVVNRIQSEFDVRINR